MLHQRGTVVFSYHPVRGMEAFVSREQELYDFILEAWPGRYGDRSTLPNWLGKARLAFPSVDLVKEAKKAFMWEAARPSRTKKSIRRFLTNWWANSQERAAGKPASVVPIEAARWLRKHNKAPDYLFKRWVARKGIDNEQIDAFCSYFGIETPYCYEELIDLYEGSE